MPRAQYVSGGVCVGGGGGVCVCVSEFDTI